MKSIDIGQKSFVSSDKVLSIIPVDSAPIKRRMQNATAENRMIDATFGRKTRSILFLTDGVIVASSVESKTLSLRANHQPK